MTWQWQLTTPIDTGVAAQVFDIDGVENDAAVVAALHAAGRRVVCYVNAGAAENFRPDYQSFPEAFRGKSNGEQCFEYDECSALTPFIRAGKAVLHVEYDLDTTQFCAKATELRFSSMRKRVSLDAARWPC